MVQWQLYTNPSAKDVDAVAKKAKIPLVDLQELLDPKERPRMYRTKTSFAAVIRVVADLNHFPAICIVKTKTVVYALSKYEVPFLTEYFTSQTAKKKNRSFGHLIDALINEYFAASRHIEDAIDTLDESMFHNDDDDEDTTLKKLFQVKKELIHIHKAVRANRELMGQLDNTKHVMLSKSDNEFIHRSFFDVVQLLDHLDTFRELSTASVEIYFSSVSNKLNKVMKTLTVGATLLLVPTLIAGIYGMNFRVMPEIEWLYGYPFSLALMFVSSFLAYLWFRKKKLI